MHVFIFGKSAIRTLSYPLMALVLFFAVSSAASANSIFLKYGQSRNITVPAGLETVFVSNPRVADYKVINDKNIVIYAKSTGNSELIVYGKNSKVLLKRNISVDPFLGDLNQRVSKEFPGNNVEITRFVGDANADKVTYIISGTVSDEESMDAIYRLVGATISGVRDDEKDSTRNIGETNKVKDISFMKNRRYENVINRMQLLNTNQVNVQLTVVEVSKSFTDALGIDWSSLTLDSIMTGGTTANNPGVFSLIGFKGGFDSKNISNTINAIQNDSVARIMAQPNLTVLSGETADFLVGGEIPILTKNDNNEGTSVTYKEYGIKLSIAAKVEKKQKIKLYLSNEISSVSGSYAYNTYNIPTLVTRRSSSTIELADGDSFVIGGLLSENDKETLGKVPFIGEIPILGALARNSSTQREKTELVIFATVNLVRPVTSTQPIYLPDYNKSNSSQLFFNVNVDEVTYEDRLSQNTHNFLNRGGFSK
ncbi:pilus assembly protein N-terminal domain-containing protein [Budviciaceae bacterium BWR-B9]|uniref:Pilus assembly protein N-terminal domain-containing protein n=2 Tax=Budviciaceae TaxID=1903416 RepID=A0ABS1IP54_9GAMM|nr:pilus assembly protein N-terminal domain-containing protein [Limnobaculum allomyrinae]MBV7691422.1 pilus assembly protein N-terminal domain-containing protein [Limnobaculum sp. M2-1]